MKKTRTFGFPNNGHSIRKLVVSLRELGSIKVILKYEPCQYHNMNNFDIWFEETDSPNNYYVFNASKLADKLLTLGTRFTAELQYDQIQLSFHTEWDDIAQNPQQYNVL